MSFKILGKEKNIKIPLSAIWLVQRDFFVYYIKYTGFTFRSSLPS